MGAVRSKMMKPLRNFNVESRAHKALDKQKIKPVPAPHHKLPPTVSTTEGQPEPDPVANSRDELLHERLKVVRVESIGPANKSFESRNLPERSTSLPEPEYGVVEPDQVTPGRVTISQALNLISDHQTNPKLHSAANIAQQYNLELYNTQQMLKHFQVFHMHFPKKMEERFPHLLSMLKTQMSSLESERQKKLLDLAKESDKTESSETVKNIEKSS
ncbi:NADH dehydrogenase [ubiquinone] 1 alpha subcomplex assembly factor 4-like [Argonauta hians]